MVGLTSQFRNDDPPDHAVGYSSFLRDKPWEFLANRLVDPREYMAEL
jgi:hypothetical protein